MIKKLLISSVFTLSSLSLNAQAAVFNLGTLVPQDTNVMFNLFGGTLGDTYTFDVASTFAFTSEVAGYDVTNFNLSLTKDSTFLFNHDSSAGVPPVTGFTSGTLLSMTEKTLSAGNYTLSIIGNSTDGGSAYVGSFTVGRPAAAVPEPETYAMFMAGLGLLGFVSRRRAVKSRK